jgi:hypothetical protein
LFIQILLDKQKKCGIVSIKNNIQVTEKGKLSERIGRKATGPRGPEQFGPMDSRVAEVIRM